MIRNVTQESQPVPAILIVEDNPPTLAVVRELVAAAFPACCVLAAESAESALAHFANPAAPQVVVMDIALPGIDGIEATRQIKALRPRTQVVMHSSYDLPIYRHAAAAAGAAAFIAKGRIHRDLVPAIAELLARTLPPS